METIIASFLILGNFSINTSEILIFSPNINISVLEHDKSYQKSSEWIKKNIPINFSDTVFHISSLKKGKIRVIKYP